jgi:hypothetical protein
VTPKKYNTETILCACGCGEHRLKYDKTGRERWFIKGHNKPARPDKYLERGILRALETGTAGRSDLAYLSNASNEYLAKVSVGHTLRRLEDQGKVRRIRHNVWGLAC